MADNKLVTIAKAGEPKLKILAASLAEHVKLGWKHVEDEVERIEDEVKALVTKKSTTVTLNK